MKGLILKDFYQLKSYTRVFLAVVVFCVLMGFSNQDVVFMSYYPGILMGMMPITMYAYDEKAKFHTLLSALPVKKSTYVSAKYVFGLLLTLGACAATGTIQSIKMVQAGSFVFSEFAMIMALALAVGLIAPAVVLPFIFVFGTEKGRFVNIIVVAFCICMINIFMEMGDDFQVILDAQQVVLVVIGAAVVLYVLSWAFSSKIFEKKEF